MRELKAVFADYPHTLPLKDGRVTSDKIRLTYIDYPVVHEAFDIQVEEQPYDVCEMAVATFFQALDFGRPLRLLPVVCLGSFHHGSIWYDTRLGKVTTEDLKGARVAVRAYTQTTGLWVRGALEEQFGIRPSDVTWVTTEAPHVAGYISPPNVIKLPDETVLLDLVTSGDCRAVILGPKQAKAASDVPLRPVVEDVDAAVKVWRERHNAFPINHMLTVTDDLAEKDPEAVRELWRMLSEGYAAAQAAGELSPAVRIGVDAVWHTLEVAMEYCCSQKLISRRFTREEVFAAPVFESLSPAGR